MSEVKFSKHIIQSNKDFYALGLRDSIMYKKVSEHMTSIVSGNTYLKQAIKSIITFQQSKLDKNELYYRSLEHYTEGLGVKKKDFIYTFLFPEIVASFNRWIPNLLGFVPGCSSAFIRGERGVIHSRILDYTASESLIESERALIIDLPGKLKVAGFSFCALPFPSLTAMNEKGLTLAIHYKHGDFFHQGGSSIFEIALDVLQHSKTVTEAKKRLRTHQSIAHWGLYLSDKTYKVGAFDLRGSDLVGDIYDIKDYDYLYFNNRMINEEKHIARSQPFGHRDFCLMRKRAFSKLFYQNKPKDALALHQTLSQNYITESNDWCVSPLTISSSQVITFDSSKNQAIVSLGETPKFNSQKIISFEDIFSSKAELLQDKADLNPYELGKRHLAKAQRCLDASDVRRTYYHLQMSMAYHKKDYDSAITHFYFNVVEYIYNKNDKDLYYILRNFIQLRGQLPTYLQDHCILFEFRIRKLLKENYDLDTYLKEINNSNLKNILIKEDKLKIFSLKMLRKLIYPRMELMDIIYSYS